MPQRLSCRPARLTMLAVLSLTLPWSALAADNAQKRGARVAAGSIERGRYLVRIGGCNDCHTAGYPESGGAVAEKEWLTGNTVGYRGPWGTTYAANLRLSMARISEEEWLRLAHGKQFRPPMPWFALRDMRAADLRDIHRFIRHLGPAGSPAPEYVGPGDMPKGPVVQFPG